ncbi:hypothetical protein [Psychrobacter frigidicola]|uniref:hypothetical protein n=1 Tax=Psychrobacter frigidicola TaxID=45611 RepID=UPI00191B8ECE|nr:hypothetical protein [Psychrobacter frigidicola]
MDVEEVWQEFVGLRQGKFLSNEFGTSVNFANADFWFDKYQVIIELRKIQAASLDKKKDDTHIKENNLSFSDVFEGKFSNNFWQDYTRLVRLPISRMLKKANQQIKKWLKCPESRGVVMLVNDGITSFSIRVVSSLIANILANSYSSIDGFILVTMNSYIVIKDSNV